MFNSVIYFISFAIITVFLFILFVNFLSLSAAYLFGISLGWLAVFIFSSRKNLQLHPDTTPKINLEVYEKLTNRNYEILASGEAPIVCPSCGSFVSARKINCPVFHDPIPDQKEV